MNAEDLMEVTEGVLGKSMPESEVQSHEQNSVSETFLKNLHHCQILTSLYSPLPQVFGCVCV